MFLGLVVHILWLVIKINSATLKTVWNHRISLILGDQIDMVQKHGPDQDAVLVSQLKRVKLETEQAALFNSPYVVLRLKRVAVAVNLQCKGGKFPDE